MIEWLYGRMKSPCILRLIDQAQSCDHAKGYMWCIYLVPYVVIGSQSIGELSGKFVGFFFKMKHTP